MTKSEHMTSTEEQLLKAYNSAVLASYELSLCQAKEHTDPTASKLHYLNFIKYKTDALDFSESAINLMESA